MDSAVRDERVRTPGHGYCGVSWSAVVAGALVAFALSALLNLLNAGLGLVAFPETFRGLTGVTVGGYLWLIICGIIAMFIAGWVAGKIASAFGNGCCQGVLHGFLAWSLALLLTIWVGSHFVHAGANVATKVDSDRADVSRVLDRGENVNAATAEDAADAAGTATIGLFFIFLLGAAAAALGGYIGSRNDIGPKIGSDHTHHTPTPKY